MKHSAKPLKFPQNKKADCTKGYRKKPRQYSADLCNLHKKMAVFSNLVYITRGRKWEKQQEYLDTNEGWLCN